MDLSQANAKRGSELPCRHPPERIVLGNDRMEPTCSLCGKEMPFEAFVYGDLDLKHDSAAAERRAGDR
ncbi:MAG: hypothetical protein ACM3SS_12895 [Rhodospirillaceae bacterium]